MVGPSQVEAPVGKVTDDADELQDAAGTRKPLTLLPRFSTPLLLEPAFNDHPP